MDRPASVDPHVAPQPPPVREAVLRCLKRFSPRIEAAENRFAFRLDASGVAPLFPSLPAWAAELHGDFLRMGFNDTAVVAGFSHFAVAATARCTRGVTIFERQTDERAALMQVPLSSFDLPPKSLHRLARLDIRTLKDLLGLPEAGTVERFGPELKKLHRQAAQALWDPMQPLSLEAPPRATRELDDPVTDRTRLTFLARRLLVSALDEARNRTTAAAAVTLTLSLDRAPRVRTEITPAEPTLDAVQLADLLRLRLETIPLDSGVTGLTVEIATVPVPKEQLLLFHHKPRRDPAAADRALARLRAEFGTNAVVRAELREGHLPEAGFAFVPMEHINADARKNSSPLPAAENNVLVRRIYADPIPLQPRPVTGPRGCHFLGMGEAPAVRMNGPFHISGGWWNRDVRREYYYAETETGRILWLYFDRCRRRWFLHGEVE